MAAPKGKLWVQAQLGLPPLLLLTMALAGGSGTAAAEAFDSVLGDTASCHRACQLTYPLHTYPKEEELYACQRGCRLFSICQFVDDGIDLNRTKLECESACTEAYSQPDEQYACHLGCQDQLPFAELRQEQLMSLMPRMHLLFPLTLVRSFWSDMMDSAQSFITSSWTFYLQADDGKIVIFQSKPEIQYAPQLEQEPTNLREPSLSKMSYLQMRNSQAHRNYLEDEESDSFLRCLSLNSGWILTTTLVLSVMVLLWICCAAVATAVEQYVPPEKLSIYGDLEFMNEQKLSRYPASSLVVVRSQTEDHEEAGPLPTKGDAESNTAAGGKARPGEEGCGPFCCSRRGACLSAFLMLVLAMLATLLAVATILGRPPRIPGTQSCVTMTNRTGFLCHDRRHCIPAHGVCDGILTCPYGEDEDERLCRDVPRSLPSFLLAYCGDPASWIYSDQKCDGTNNCGDCSDELSPGGGLGTELESALVYGEPRTSPFFFLSSDCMPTLWPWMVEMHSNCLQVLQLYPEGAVPGPCAALL
ncbi:transmembrane protein 59 [Cricetulus griseus]